MELRGDADQTAGPPPVHAIGRQRAGDGQEDAAVNGLARRHDAWLGAACRSRQRFDVEAQGDAGGGSCGVRTQNAGEHGKSARVLR